VLATLSLLAFNDVEQQFIPKVPDKIQQEKSAVDSVDWFIFSG
jgi:hypothetical protein